MDENGEPPHHGDRAPAAARDRPSPVARRIVLAVVAAVGRPARRRPRAGRARRPGHVGGGRRAGRGARARPRGGDRAVQRGARTAGRPARRRRGRRRPSSSRRRPRCRPPSRQSAASPAAAYTGESMSSFRALMTSDSADEFVDRVATLQMVAGHQNEILDRAAAASVAAAQAQATAQEAAAAGAGHLRRRRRPAGRPRGADRRVPGPLRPAHASRSGRPPPRPRAHGDRASRAERSAPLAAATGPVVAGSQAAQIAVDTAMAQRGKPYVWAAVGPGLLRLLRADHVRLRGRRRQPAALQPDAGGHGPVGLPRPAPARRPGLLLQPDQPRGHLHRQRPDGARADVGRRRQGVGIDAMGGYAGATRIAG